MLLAVALMVNTWTADLALAQGVADKSGDLVFYKKVDDRNIYSAKSGETIATYKESEFKFYHRKSGQQFKTRGEYFIISGRLSSQDEALLSNFGATRNRVVLFIRDESGSRAELGVGALRGGQLVFLTTNYGETVQDARTGRTVAMVARRNATEKEQQQIDRGPIVIQTTFFSVSRDDRSLLTSTLGIQPRTFILSGTVERPGTVIGRALLSTDGHFPTDVTTASPGSLRCHALLVPGTDELGAIVADGGAAPREVGHFVYRNEGLGAVVPNHTDRTPDVNKFVAAVGGRVQ